MANKSIFLSFSSLMMILSGIFLFNVKATAIPEFARKYNTSCTTCHVAITKRNAFGEAFRRNGYILPYNDAELVREKPIKLGADAWKELWPEAIWPGELPASFPIAALTIFRTNYNPQTEPGNTKFDFHMPLIFNLIFGGSFGQDVMFFGEWSAFAAGVNARGLQRLFFQFNNVVGPDNIFNIRAGRFEPGITDGYTSTQRLTSGYQITIDYNPTGNWKARDPQSGIELNGIINHNIYYATGILNGESRTISDPGDQKDFYGRLAYLLGGEGFAGKNINYGDVNNTFSDNSFMAGVYGYKGSKNKIPLNDGTTYNNIFHRIGFDINLHISKLDLIGGLISGEDNNPDNDLRILKSLAYFGEVNYSFYPWLIGILRVEKAESWKSNEDRDNFINVIPNITILYRANIRFSLEGFIRIMGDRNINGNIISAQNDKPFRELMLNLMAAF